MDTIRHTICPILAAFIWGTAFVAQDLGSKSLDTFSFSFARSIVGFFFLLLLSIAYDLVSRKHQKKKGTFQEKTPEEHREIVKKTLLAGLICGTVLSVPSVLQQQGIAMSGAAKSGFLTSLYVVLVPIFSIFLHKKPPTRVWIAVALAVVGLYFICIKAGTDMTVSTGDLFLIGCALTFCIQILTVDHFSELVDGIKLSCLQFGVMSIETGICALIFEDATWTDYKAVLLPILYCGIFSSGIGYTLQIISQKGGNPTIISLLMSLESVFSVVASAIILHQILTGREYLGCVLMLAAVILAQIPVELLLTSKKKQNNQEEEVS